MLEFRTEVTPRPISKKLNYLVVGDSKPTNSKVEKAKDLNIEIISEKKWYELLNR